MRSRKIIWLEKILRFMASRVLAKYKPQVVGITGSVGKTSTTQATYAVLSSKFVVNRNIKNYNNEIGIPLSIIGQESGHKSLLKWLKIFFHWLKIIVFRCSYPQILILEMGVDRPNDMKYLLGFVPVKIAVLTAIAPVHLENFKNLEHLAREKARILEVLKEDDYAVLNADDPLVMEQKTKIKAKTITYGFSPEAEVRASDEIFAFENGLVSGLSFKINYEGKTVPVRLRHILAFHQIEAALAAVCVGIICKMNLVEIATALEKFQSPPGRMSLIEGVNQSLILDDTYNSSPRSVEAALKVLHHLPAQRKIVVLGDMLELGQFEEEGHRIVARKIFETGADYFLALGDRMKITLQEIKRLGFPAERTISFESHADLAKHLKEMIKKGDIILVKGSQSMRMEKVVEKIMAQPEKARDLLCRQSGAWWRKPYKKP